VGRGGQEEAIQNLHERGNGGEGGDWNRRKGNHGPPPLKVEMKTGKEYNSAERKEQYVHGEGYSEKEILHVLVAIIKLQSQRANLTYGARFRYRSASNGSHESPKWLSEWL
jgi:hypothetical protein